MDDLLATAGYRPAGDELCDAPFRTKRRFRRRTRFSDGSFPVFYAALEVETAEAEIRYWLPTFAGEPQHSRTAYYELLCCAFEGAEKDLRPKEDEWRELVHDHDYAFCNSIGAAALQEGLDGLAVPSARRDGGTNIPVFQRAAIRDPEIRGTLSITYEPSAHPQPGFGRSGEGVSSPRSSP